DAPRHTTCAALSINATHPHRSQFFTPHSIPLPHCLPYYCATLAPLASAGTILVLRLFRRGMPLLLAHDFDRMA
ncbi:hypothetical protein, partial [Pseudomonas syringae]|uniref:hypothetical protein n=1 Tax=Pseudomonas syringae TaxID=317 RepID=UPI001C067DF0